MFDNKKRCKPTFINLIIYIHKTEGFNTFILHVNTLGYLVFDNFVSLKLQGGVDLSIYSLNKIYQI